MSRRSISSNRRIHPLVYDIMEVMVRRYRGLERWNAYPDQRNTAKATAQLGLYPIAVPSSQPVGARIFVAIPREPAGTDEFDEVSPQWAICWGLAISPRLCCQII